VRKALIGLSLFLSLSALAQPTRVTVTSPTDAVNGDVRSPAALDASPGPDGVSLREALLAVNSASIPAHIELDSSLTGSTIQLSEPLPPIVVNDTAILGPPNASAPPTLELGGVSGSNCAALIIAASGVTIARIRFVNVLPAARVVQVYAGEVAGNVCTRITAPSRVRNVLIVNCEFDNAPHETTAYAISIGTDPGAVAAQVSDVRVLRNRFHHFRGDGTTVHVQLGGRGNVVERVMVEENQFIECMFAVELVNCCGGQVDNSITDVTITRNHFDRGGNIAVVLGTIGVPNMPVATRNRIDRTIIARNTMFEQDHWAVIVNGGFNNATENKIADVNITNNIIARGVDENGGGILVLGGDEGGISNSVSGVRVVNNTFARNLGTAMAAADNPGGSSNLIQDLLVRNNIFWQNGADLGSRLTLAQVDHSMTTHPDFIGRNGNFAGEPAFINPSADDYRLLAGSEAIDRGSTNAAPSEDVACGLRAEAVDLGAYEYNAAPVAGLLITGGGSGSGAVELLPGGRACGALFRVFEPGTSLSISPTAATGSSFTGWVGEGCTSGSIVLAANRFCAALFRASGRRRSARH